MHRLSKINTLTRWATVFWGVISSLIFLVLFRLLTYETKFTDSLFRFTRFFICFRVIHAQEMCFNYSVVFWESFEKIGAFYFLSYKITCHRGNEEIPKIWPRSLTVFHHSISTQNVTELIVKTLLNLLLLIWHILFECLWVLMCADDFPFSVSQNSTMKINGQLE